MSDPPCTRGVGGAEVAESATGDHAKTELGWRGWRLAQVDGRGRQKALSVAASPASVPSAAPKKQSRPAMTPFPQDGGSLATLWRDAGSARGAVSPFPPLHRGAFGATTILSPL